MSGGPSQKGDQGDPGGPGKPCHPLISFFFKNINFGCTLHAHIYDFLQKISGAYHHIRKVGGFLVADKGAKNLTCQGARSGADPALLKTK